MFAGGLVSCRAPAPIEEFRGQLEREWASLTAFVTGAPVAKPKPLPSDKSWGKRSTAPRGPQAQANAELLREVFTVALQREPTDQAAFASYVDSMNQGASIEGLHNGFTHSAFQRKLEEETSAATDEALRVFGVELSRLQIGMKTPTHFDEGDRKPMAASADLAEIAREQTGPATRPPVVVPIDATERGLFYARLFKGASIFTLKRIFTDEALRLIDEKVADPEALAKWYGDFAAHYARKGIPFGLESRHRGETSFHQDWAGQMIANGRLDRLRWEVLNRLHRLLNAQSRDKQTPQAAVRPGT